MKWETRCKTPSLFSFVYGPASMCIISHQYNASKKYKENIGIQDILINQNALNLVNTLLLTIATSVKVWDNGIIAMMKSSSAIWSEISEWMTCCNCEFQPKIAQIIFVWRLLQRIYHFLLKKEIIIFSEWYGIIIILDKYVYWIKLFLRWLTWNMVSCFPNFIKY